VICANGCARGFRVEPFAQRLPIIAEGPRALLDLWRVAHDEDGALHGIAFAACGNRGLRKGAERPTADVYAAVAPELRRQGLGRALCCPALEWATAQGATLRARVREDARPGRAFLRAIGFVETSAQLTLAWSARAVEVLPMPALRIRRLAPGEATRDSSGSPARHGPARRTRSRPAPTRWRSSLPTRGGCSPGRGGTVRGGLSLRVWLGSTLGIEEVAVLPDFRRMGIGRALIAAALRAWRTPSSRWPSRTGRPVRCTGPSGSPRPRAGSFMNCVMAEVVVREARPEDDAAVGEILVSGYLTRYAQKMPEVVLTDRRKPSCATSPPSGGRRWSSSRSWTEGGRHRGGLAAGRAG